MLVVHHKNLLQKINTVLEHALLLVSGIQLWSYVLVDSLFQYQFLYTLIAALAAIQLQILLTRHGSSEVLYFEKRMIGIKKTKTKKKQKQTQQ